ncbi:MAG: hypothetical protein ACJ786_28385 [Catenulispora sp.]
MTVWFRADPATTPGPRRLTPEDAAYLDGALRHAYGVFIDDPATGLDVARTMATGVLTRRGFDADALLRPFEPRPAADRDELRLMLEGLAAAIGRIVADGG